jgi:O-acetyl-ADP-ribose deacetylase (regulator of RNase III)
VAAHYVRCPTGQAKLTVGGSLNVHHVIHAVGPDYRSCEDDDKGDELLARSMACSSSASTL